MLLASNPAADILTDSINSQPTLPARADVVDLIGPDYDRWSAQPAQRTLIICSAPRTASYELCRMLTAAGIGVPHEYFNPVHAREVAERWKIAGDPLAQETIGEYLNLLRCRRAANGIFSIKLQYWQIDRFLSNRHGYSLFDGACVVHLFRSDVKTQFASWRRARATGRWDFSQRRTTDPVESPAEDQRLEQALSDIDLLIKEDSGFRRLFLLLGIQPLFVTFEDIIMSPQATVDRIAKGLGVSVDVVALAETIAQSAPYAHNAAVHERVDGQLICDLREQAFRK